MVTVAERMTENGVSPYGIKCDFNGDYELLSEKFAKISEFNLLQWPRMTVDKFGCLLEKQLNCHDKKFNCPLKNYKFTGDPLFENYFEGPEFSQDKVKLIHNSIKTMQIDFEHGDLRSVSVFLKNLCSFRRSQEYFRCLIKNWILIRIIPAFDKLWK